MWPVRRDMERRLAAGQTCGVPKTEGTDRELLKRRQALGTCVRHAGMEPPTTAAARAIRPGGLWRTGSCGTQSPAGSGVVEVLRPVVATLKQQHRHVRDSVSAAGEAALWGEPAPSRLPTLDALNQVMRPAASLHTPGERLQLNKPLWNPMERQTSRQHRNQETWSGERPVHPRNGRLPRENT
jgi:hypothetical protein